MSDATTTPKRHVLAAWIVGGVIYMIFAMEVVADAGFMAFPFQAIMGAVFSIVFVGVAALIGFMLDIPPLARFWYSSSSPSIIVLVFAVFVILFGQSLGLATTISLAESNSTYKTLHPAAAYGSMLAAVFATLHFPRRKASHDRPSA
jgi:hypothetical protein